MAVKGSFALLFAALIAVAAGLALTMSRLQVFPVPPDNTIAAAPAGWREVDWPLARDQFGAGKAFECDEKSCGAALRVTFRAKIGFCNCATGVSDDEELDRIGDVALVGDSYRAGPEGREIRVGRMKGRSRAYAADSGDGPASMLSIAFNERCDVIVATAIGRDPVASEARVLDFLNSAPVTLWAERALGL